MDEKKLTYFNIMLAVAVGVAIVLLIRNTSGLFAPASGVKEAAQMQAAQAQLPVAAQPEKPMGVIVPAENVRNLKDVYANFPRHDAGANMIEAWSRVKPEDKARYMEGVDKQITAAKEAMAVNPSDKKAKHMLFIAETMRKLAENGFNYSAPEGTRADDKR